MDSYPGVSSKFHLEIFLPIRNSVRLRWTSWSFSFKSNNSCLVLMFGLSESSSINFWRSFKPILSGGLGTGFPIAKNSYDYFSLMWSTEVSRLLSQLNLVDARSFILLYTSGNILQMYSKSSALTIYPESGSSTLHVKKRLFYFKISSCPTIPSVT